MKQLQRQFYYKLTPGMRLVVRKLFFSPIDLWETITGKRHKYEPPKGDIYIGSGAFITQGRHQLELLKKYIRLKPEDAVLDVGSGIGRTAVALTQYLTFKQLEDYHHRTARHLPAKHYQQFWVKVE